LGGAAVARLRLAAIATPAPRGQLHAAERHVPTRIHSSATTCAHRLCGVLHYDSRELSKSAERSYLPNAFGRAFTIQLLVVLAGSLE
jgi:hypothetical protein